MLPKEKAKALVEKFKEIEIGSEGFHSWGMTDWQARQAAIIAVDEIIDSTREVKEIPFDYHNPLKTTNSVFWQQVKEEIEKM
jgi:hypothetical protein